MFISSLTISAILFWWHKRVWRGQSAGCLIYLSGIVVVGINRPKAKNAISKNLVKMVCIAMCLLIFFFFLIMVRPKQTIHKFHLGFYLPALHIGFFVLRSFRELGYLGYTLYVVMGHCGSGAALRSGRSAHLSLFTNNS